MIRPREVKNYRIDFLSKRLMAPEIVQSILERFAELKTKHDANEQFGYVFDHLDYRVLAHYKLLTNEHVLQPVKPDPSNEVASLNKTSKFVFLS